MSSPCGESELHPAEVVDYVLLESGVGYCTFSSLPTPDSRSTKSTTSVAQIRRMVDSPMKVQTAGLVNRQIKSNPMAHYHLLSKQLSGHPSPNPPVVYQVGDNPTAGLSTPSPLSRDSKNCNNVLASRDRLKAIYTLILQ
ncbi:glutaryl-CoA dehydrogenase [Striga asiatica]|uniref:Glutaryl-CoA dehydrogenase n=1 Tax=Striga asiatica TaxID=4170 RepID=A0A5A7Q358_STRAF|nr:glutaryl-CoA dehydrogenase [Striga asiatica]